MAVAVVWRSFVEERLDGRDVGAGVEDVGCHWMADTAAG